MISSSNQTPPQGSATLRAGERYLTIKSFRTLLRRIGVPVNKRRFTVWFRYPLPSLPREFQAVLANAPEQWYVVLHGEGGWAGQVLVVPVRYLHLTYAHYATHQQLTGVYKQHLLSIRTIIDGLLVKHPFISSRTVQEHLREHGHAIGRSHLLQILREAKQQPTSHTSTLPHPTPSVYANSEDHNSDGHHQS